MRDHSVRLNEGNATPVETRNPNTVDGAISECFRFPANSIKLSGNIIGILITVLYDKPTAKVSA